MTKLKNFFWNNVFIKKGFDFFFKYLRKSINKSGGQGIAVVSINKIGDCIFTLPAVSAIVENFPDKKITIITSQYGAEIYKYFYPEYNIVTLTKDMFWSPDWYLVTGFKARKILKEVNPEIIFDLTLTHTSAFLIFNSRAKQIIGSNRKELFKGLYTSFAPCREEPTLVDMYIDAIQPVIPEAVSYKTKFKKNDKFKEGRILIQPMAGWKSKEWGISKYISLAVSLKQHYHIEFVLESGALLDEVITEIKNAGIHVNVTRNLTELIKLTEESSVMISNDTGCIYLAAELGKATYTIYGPTNPLYHLPVGDNHGHIQKKIICTPIKEKICFTHGGLVGCPSFECMIQLTTREVIQDVEAFLDRIGIQKTQMSDQGQRVI